MATFQSGVNVLGRTGQNLYAWISPANVNLATIAFYRINEGGIASVPSSILCPGKMYALRIWNPADADPTVRFLAYENGNWYGAATTNANAVSVLIPLSSPLRMNEIMHVRFNDADMQVNFIPSPYYGNVGYAAAFQNGAQISDCAQCGCPPSTQCNQATKVCTGLTAPPICRCPTSICTPVWYAAWQTWVTLGAILLGLLLLWLLARYLRVPRSSRSVQPEAQQIFNVTV